MTVDTASLEIRVLSDKVEDATKRLEDLERASRDADGAADGLASTFKKLLAPILGLVTATEGLRKLVEVQREFDILNSGLVTATKSSENAAVAFQALQKFAAETPYDLKQAVEGFTQLVNLGLTPSERALRSYGNTASALGKDLSDMIGAVADASTFEFERLKEFGIKSKQGADTIKFTFQGVTTEVKKNAGEIEKYLMAIGENQFAGAMAERAKTLDGAISQLGDTWDGLFRAVSQSGVGSLIKDSVDLANDGIQELIDELASGQVEAELRKIAIKFIGFGQDAEESFGILTNAIDADTKYWSELLELNVKNMSDTFGLFPENVRAFIKLMTVEVAAGLDVAEAYAVGFASRLKAELSFGDQTKEIARVATELETKLKGISQARMGSIEDILKERDATIESGEAQRKAADYLRTTYDENRKARAKDAQDRLAKFKLAGEKPDGDQLSDAQKKEIENERKKNLKEFENLVASLDTEQEALEISYAKRRQIIENFTSGNLVERDRLMERLDKDFQKEMDQLNGIMDKQEERKKIAAEVAEIEAAGWNDSQKAAYNYQKQMETLWIAQSKGVISEEQHTDAVNQVTLSYEKLQNKASDSFFDIEEFSKQAARNSQDAFADFLFDPFSQGLDGMALGFAKVVQRMVAEAAAAKLAANLFGASGGGSGKGWLGTLAGVAGSALGAWFGGGASALSSAATSGAAQGATDFTSQFGPTNGAVSFPGRAAGGPTSPGQAYEVGERGVPEILSQGGKNYLLPGNASGHVTSLKDSGGSSPPPQINIEQTFVIQSDGSVSEGSGSSSADTNANEFVRKIRAVTLKTVQDEMRDGGSIYNMVNRRT